MVTKKEPWRSEDWFVSPWNFLEEVRRDFHPPRQVKIHDITLRDGEQQAGIVFRKDDKIRIAEGLAEAGVHRIEAGMPVVSPQDEAAIKEIVKRNLGPEIFCFCRCMVDDVKRAVDCGVDGIVIEIPASQHLVEHGYGWPMQKAIDLPIKATQFAKEQGLYTVFFTIDATRSDMDWYLNLIKKVATEGHMDALALVDTFGVLSPHGAFYYAKTVRERVDKPLEIHFHNTFGMATANTIMSVLYGIDVGIKYDKLTGLSELVGELSGVPASRPFVSDMVNDIESGIPASWHKKLYEQYPTDLFPIRPRFVGHREPNILMGKKSGLDSVAIWAEKLGIELTEEETLEVLRQVKQRSYDHKRLLTEDEFQEITQGVKASSVAPS
jgi:isopropylmalate/homocitrate/citramalate synthase